MKTMFSKVLLALVLAVPLTLSASNKQNLLTIITSEDSMTQLMGLVLTTEAKKQGANVEVLFCSKAADIVIKYAKEVTFKPKGISPNKLVKDLIKSGVSVGVCPPYLPNNGKTVSDLIDGVSVVKPAIIAEKILAEDTQVLSY